MVFPGSCLFFLVASGIVGFVLTYENSVDPSTFERIRIYVCTCIYIYIYIYIRYYNIYISEVGGVSPTGKSFRFVCACARSCM